MRSAPIVSPCVAEAEMFSTMRPSLTKARGTSTPAKLASTRACGVWPLSTIHSIIARNRYGRRESSANAHLLLGLRQAETEARAGEDAAGVFQQGRLVLR